MLHTLRAMHWESIRCSPCSKHCKSWPDNQFIQSLLNRYQITYVLNLFSQIKNSPLEIQNIINKEVLAQQKKNIYRCKQTIMHQKWSHILNFSRIFLAWKIPCSSLTPADDIPPIQTGHKMDICFLSYDKCWL